MNKFYYTSGYAKFNHNGHDFVVDFTTNGMELRDLLTDRTVEITDPLMHMLTIHAEKLFQEWKHSPEYAEMIAEVESYSRGNDEEKNDEEENENRGPSKGGRS